MRTSVLVLNGHFGGLAETEQYILHFSELFTNLGYRITLGYGKKSPPGYSSPVISELECPPLAKDGKPSSAGALNNLSEQVNTAQPHLIFIHDVFHWPLLDAVRRGAPGTPMVWFAHDRFFALLGTVGLSAPQPPRDGLLPWLEDFAGVRHVVPEAGRMPSAVRTFLEFASGFEAIVVSSGERARIMTGCLQLPPARVHIVPGRTAQPAPIHGEWDGGGILYAGSISPRKEIGDLIGAMNRIRGVSPLRLVLAGPVPDAGYLAQCRLLAEQAMTMRDGLVVDFHPDPPAETMERLYAEAEVLVCTCGHSHTFPVAVQEAMERGLPVVAFDLGALDTLVRDRVTGLLARPGDMRDLARRLEWMLLHREEARRMGRVARNVAAWEFHSRDHVAALNRLFEDLILHRSAAPGKSPAGQLRQLA